MIGNTIYFIFIKYKCLSFLYYAFNTDGFTFCAAFKTATSNRISTIIPRPVNYPVSELDYWNKKAPINLPIKTVFASLHFSSNNNRYLLLHLLLYHCDKLIFH